MTYVVGVVVNENHFKCIAGVLNVFLDVWNGEHELFDVYLPCPCDVSCNEISRPTGGRAYETWPICVDGGATTQGNKER